MPELLVPELGYFHSWKPEVCTQRWKEIKMKLKLKRELLLINSLNIELKTRTRGKVPNTAFFQCIKRQILKKNRIRQTIISNTREEMEVCKPP